MADVASLKQQIASEQLQAVLAQLELGDGAGNGPGAPPQLTPKAEQLARIDERQKYQDALDAGFDLAKTRLSLLAPSVTWKTGSANWMASKFQRG